MSSRFLTILVGIFLVVVMLVISGYTALSDAPSTDAWTQRQINKREELYRQYHAAIERGATEEEVFELQNEIRDVTKRISDHITKH